MKKDLVTLLKEKEIFKRGKFTLRSGKTSDYYIDLREAIGDMEILKKIINKLVLLIPQKTTCIAGSGYGGIALASLVAFKKKLPLTLVRDKVKNHGTKNVIEGYIPTSNDAVCIIDDVFTTGSSVSDSKKKLSFTKTKFTKPVVVLNRSKSKSVLSLLSEKDLTN